METITKFFKEENDFLYRKGREEERAKHEQEKVKLITNLITKSDWHDEQIADIAEVPANFVKSVRDSLNK